MDVGEHSNSPAAAKTTNDQTKTMAESRGTMDGPPIETGSGCNVDLDTFTAYPRTAGNCPNFAHSSEQMGLSPSPGRFSDSGREPANSASP
jgi:hypothetical protein